MKLLVVVALLLGLHRPADACATAPPRGAEARVADEEAIILWDPVAKRETFIRRARFYSTVQKFGFLVPTPSKPDLGELDNEIFQKLADDIRPEIITDDSGTKVSVESLFGACVHGLKKSSDGRAKQASGVRVIQAAHVAGMDATTLSADDPKALADWLAGHGFEATPELEAWLGIYTQQHWMMTAFVIASDQSDASRFDVATKAVKMTFSAEQPFYPYREPETKNANPDELMLPPRMLRVFFISDQRYTGKGWPATTLYSAPTQLPGELYPGKLDRLTVFIDESSPRIAKDEVFFQPNADQAEVKQPPIIVHNPTKIVIPLEAIAFALILVLLLVMRQRRKKRA